AYPKDSEAGGGRAFSGALLDAFQDLLVHVSGVTRLAMTDGRTMPLSGHRTLQVSLLLHTPFPYAIRRHRGVFTRYTGNLEIYLESRIPLALPSALRRPVHKTSTP
ncbi:MAG: hypothetical protein ACREBC_39305, partial [Pyrinomonadaceae bacterium]